MALLPAAKQVAAVVLIAGIAGTGSIAALVKDAEGPEVQLPLPAITVYAVPRTAPLIAPAAPTAGPAGVNTYVNAPS